MKNHLLICYPEYSDDLVRINNWEEFGRFNKYFKIFGLRCIRYITGIDNYIVNNDVAEAIARQELGNDIKLVKMFLPLPDLKVNNKKNIKASIVFGTFGVPSHRKFTCEIIEAITILKNVYNLDIVLLIAGYKANEFLKNLNVDKNIVYIYDNPNDEEFFELLNSVDYGIQLRKFAYGESSGPITQLLSLKKEVIVNESFIDKNFEDYIHVVEDKICINSLELAKVLKSILDKNCKLNNINKDLYSFEVLQKLFLEL
ncbi:MULTISPECIES: hypothetical protein [unclassified Campylobacter]|uniref:hypothetical protein n=1 Tax=unclassified Campylobacter TaxID=2593542 RepID=UPI001D4C12EA|nr:hypothetical protein [Campylobacter sp. RM9331]MBZ8005872.1 hypothetical protein [Campylobacter sp. RM9332]